MSLQIDINIFEFANQFQWLLYKIDLCAGSKVIFKFGITIDSKYTFASCQAYCNN